VASNEITFKVKVEKDGNLKVLASDAEKAAKGTDKLSGSTDNLSKSQNKNNAVEKSLYQSGLSTAKGFSKQASAISGGLVPAYAVLAANIFAITAAFNALKQAAQVQKLEEGFTVLANTAGRTATLMAENIRDITGGAISMADALRASATAFSAGFTMKEMEGLTQVARGASIALGRDLGDSLDRLVRGVAKLEPEILDELGIFIKIDDAARKYAASLDVSATSLTEAQRRQAFLNEALEQGSRKFAAVMQVEVNPFNNLAAAALNLKDAFLGMVNSGIAPFIQLLSQSWLAMVGVAVMFANTIGTQMLPFLFKMAEGQRENASAAKAAAETEQKELDKTIKKLEEKARAQDSAAKGKYGKIKGRIGTKDEQEGDVAAGIKSLTASLNRRNKVIEASEKKKGAVLRAGYKEERDEIERTLQKLKELQAARQGKGGAAENLINLTATAEANDQLADSMDKVNEKGGWAGLKEARAQTKKFKEGLDETNTKTKGFSKLTEKVFGKKAGLWLAKFFKGASFGVRMFGVALINAIPLIGQIIFAIGLLIQVVGRWLGESTEMKDSLGNFNKVVDSMPEKFEQLEKVMKNANSAAEAYGETTAGTAEHMNKMAEKGTAMRAEYKVLAGVVAETTETFTEFAVALNSGNLTTADRVRMRWIQAVTWIKSAWSTLTDFLLAPFRKLADVLSGLGINIGDLLLGDQDAMVATTTIDAYVNAQSKLLHNAKDLETGATLAKSLGLDISAAKLASMSLEELQEKIRTVATEQFNTAAANLGNATAQERNAAGAKALTDNLKKQDDTMVKLNGTADGSMVAFGKMGENFKKFYTDASSSDKFANMAEDTTKLLEGFREISKNDELFANFKKNEGSWLEAFFKKPWEKVTWEDIEKKFEDIQAKAKKIAEANKLAKEQTEKWNKELGKAKAELKAMEAAFDFEKMVGTMNIHGKLQETVLEREERIAAHKKKALEVETKSAKIKKDIMERELDIRIIEVEILRAKAGLDTDEHTHLTNKLTLLQDIKRLSGETLAIETATNKQAIRTASLGKTISANKSAVAGTKTGSMSSRISSFNKIGSNADALGSRDDYIDRMTEDRLDQGQKTTITDQVGFGEDYDEKLKDAKLGDLKNKLEGMRGVSELLGESLRKLGPEGELAATVMEGSFVMADAMITFTDSWSNANDKMGQGAAIAGLVASTIATTASIMAAASQSRIAGIDAEIEAEKKRDGKSKASQQKIKALEKKKEQEKRKAFEQNKKMQMAMTVVSTAAAIMQVMSDATAGPTWMKIALAVMMGAMGAAQLAIIAGTSYQGGGSAAGGGVSGISVGGDRRKSTDVSKSKSGAGELAYFRGDQGIGGPENFRGAFYGRKHRAYGGNAGYVVGEQGPELFMPDRPGTIVPSDDAGSVGGAASNVTFNIHAIDAVGVEDVLVEQQGNIINMLRQVANEHGEEFFENIDDTAYTTPVVAGDYNYGSRRR